jgi:hypothetical protein
MSAHISSILLRSGKGPKVYGFHHMTVKNDSFTYDTCSTERMHCFKAFEYQMGTMRATNGDEVGGL